MRQSENRPFAAVPERRNSPRVCAVRPAKVYDPRAERYHVAETCNLSATGALLKVHRAMPIAAGDRLEVGILGPARGDSPVLDGRDLLASRVVRVVPMDRFSQAIAVEFAQPDAATLPDVSIPFDRAHARPQRQAA